ncbi:MAG: hypothetical protein PHR27_10885 [Candidatus Cloacimonetes bacterium]|nr:hypothetical protein [Candidatus Cloacimonadota bacterium]
MDIESMANVLRTEGGRHFVSDLLALCGEGCHAPTGNPISDAYTNGRRAIADDLLHLMRRIDSANESGDGLALEYTMRREALRRMREGEN